MAALGRARIDVDEAEYWDAPGGKVGARVSLMNRMVMGGGEDMKRDNFHIRL